VEALSWQQRRDRSGDRAASATPPHGPTSTPFLSRAEIRAGIERLQGLWDYFLQTAHPGTIQLEGDTAVDRAYIAEFGRMRDGSSHLNYSVYHDRYQCTPDGWKFAERAYEVRYLDTTPLSASAPPRGGGALEPADPDPAHWSRLWVRSSLIN
jgi:hypothetical protein